MIFQYCLEPVLIQRILIGLVAILGEMVTAGTPPQSSPLLLFARTVAVA